MPGTPSSTSSRLILSATRLLYEMFPCPRALECNRHLAERQGARTPLRARVRLLDDHWSLEGGHWSAELAHRLDEE